MSIAPSSWTYVELFAGVGGFGVACRRLGGRCVFASEIEPTACATWRRNFPTEAHVLRGDITKVADDAIPPHDLLVGGFPCQPFSRAGTQPATTDPKGQLYLEIVRVLRVARPAAFLLENVPGLATAEGGQAIRNIVESLRGVGYDVSVAAIDSCCLLPQRRRRLYFVGQRRAEEKPFDHELGRRRRGREEPFPWPGVPSVVRTLREVLHETSEPENAAAMAVARKATLTDAQWRKRLDACEDRTAWIAPPDEPGPTLTRGYRRAPGKAAAARAVDAAGQATVMAASTGASRQHAGGTRLWRNLVDVSSTATAAMEPGSLPRYLTPREAARMQGFPEGFWIPREDDPAGPGVALFGNAVSPPVIAAVLSVLVDLILTVRRPPRSEDAVAAAPPTEAASGPANTGEAVIGMLLDAVPAASRDDLRKRLHHTSWSQQEQRFAV
jgi:DNA (cytosine-5)-methyltransferase 1